MCTWSGIRWPSSIRLSFCAAKRRRTSPRYGRSWPNRAFRRPFGMNTTWYLHSHREWLRLSNSSIVPRPSVCLAAHGSERHDGPPNMSNFCCLPGIAGGLPRFIYETWNRCLCPSRKYSSKQHHVRFVTDHGKLPRWRAGSPDLRGGNAMDAVEGLIAKLRANPALAGKPFAVVFKLTAKEGQEGVIRQTMEQILAPTRAEPGNVTFDPHQDA